MAEAISAADGATRHWPPSPTDSRCTPKDPVLTKRALAVAGTIPRPPATRAPAEPLRRRKRETPTWSSRLLSEFARARSRPYPASGNRTWIWASGLYGPRQRYPHRSHGSCPVEDLKGDRVPRQAGGRTQCHGNTGARGRQQVTILWTNTVRAIHLLAYAIDGLVTSQE